MSLTKLPSGVLFLILFVGTTLPAQTVNRHTRISPPIASPPSPPLENSNSKEFKQYKLDLQAYKWASLHLASTRDHLLLIRSDRPWALDSTWETDWTLLVQLHPPFIRESYFLITKPKSGPISLRYAFILNGNLHWQIMFQKQSSPSITEPDIKKIKAKCGSIDSNSWPALKEFAKALSSASIHVQDNCGDTIDGFSYSVEFFSSSHTSFTAKIPAYCKNSNIVLALNQYLPLLVQQLGIDYPECKFVQKGPE